MFVLFFILPIFCIKTANAEEENSSAYQKIIEAANELLKEIDTASLDTVFSEYEFYSKKSDARDWIKELISGDYKISFNDFFQGILNMLFGDVTSLIPELAALCAIGLFLAVSEAIKPSFSDKTMGNLIFFVCAALVIGVIGNRFFIVLEKAQATVRSLAEQTQAAFPIILTLMTAAGGSVSAAIFQPSVAFLCGAMTFIAENLLFPLITLMFVFNTLSFLSPTVKLGKTKDFLKSIFKWSVGLTVVLFSVLVTVQGISAAQYDGVSLKALKYALSSSIPLVSGLVSGGFDVVFAACLLIKNAVGGLALIALLYTVAAPLLSLAALCLFLRLAAALIEPATDGRLSSLLSGTADVVNFGCAALVFSSFGYLITLLLAICALGGAI